MAGPCGTTRPIGPPRQYTVYAGESTFAFGVKVDRQRATSLSSATTAGSQCPFLIDASRINSDDATPRTESSRVVRTAITVSSPDVVSAPATPPQLTVNRRDSMAVP